MVFFGEVATWLVDVDKFVGGDCHMKECGSDVALGRHPAHFDDKDHYCPNGGPLNDRGVGVVEVQTFNLLFAAIRIAFDFEGPSRWENPHVWHAWDEGPAFEEIL
jgi:hypothetical protein